MLEMLRAGKHTIVPGVVEHATCSNGGKLAMGDKGGKNVR